MFENTAPDKYFENPLLLSLHRADFIPGLEHLPSWLGHDLIERDCDLMWGYLRLPSSFIVRYELHRRIMARLQARLDDVITQQRRAESQDEPMVKAYYLIDWYIERGTDILESKDAQEQMPVEDFERLRLSVLERDIVRSELRESLPEWIHDVPRYRKETHQLKLAIFLENQAIDDMKVCIPGTPLNDDVDLAQIDFEGLY